MMVIFAMMMAPLCPAPGRAKSPVRDRAVIDEFGCLIRLLHTPLSFCRTALGMPAHFHDLGDGRAQTSELDRTIEIPHRDGARQTDDLTEASGKRRAVGEAEAQGPQIRHCVLPTNRLQPHLIRRFAKKDDRPDGHQIGRAHV